MSISKVVGLDWLTNFRMIEKYFFLLSDTCNFTSTFSDNNPNVRINFAPWIT